MQSVALTTAPRTLIQHVDNSKNLMFGQSLFLLLKLNFSSSEVAAQYFENEKVQLWLIETWSLVIQIETHLQYPVTK